MARVLNEKQTADVLEHLRDASKIDTHTISYLFARHRNTGIRYHTDDIMTIGPDDSPFVQAGTKTTVGIYLENKYLFEPLGIFGYVNKVINGSTNKKVSNALATALKEGDITWNQYARYIDDSQWLFGGPLAMTINNSLSETVLTLPPRATKERDELLRKHAKELAAGDPQVAAHVERRIVDVALQEMREKHGDDPALALFDSGSGIDPYNQYKTICVMKGAIQDNTGESPTGYKVVTSNYDTGITKDDMALIADSVVSTAYSTGILTADSGTNGKKYNALFQRIHLRDRNSDCGSTEYLTVTIPENTETYMYRYIREGKGLKMLTPDNIKNYIGKTVQMRTPIHCKCPDPEYCSRCVGDRIYRIGTRNIGFTFLTISGSTLNASLKKKHDVSIKMYDITVEDVLKYVD